MVAGFLRRGSLRQTAVAVVAGFLRRGSLRQTAVAVGVLLRQAAARVAAVAVGVLLRRGSLRQTAAMVVAAAVQAAAVLRHRGFRRTSEIKVVVPEAARVAAVTVGVLRHHGSFRRRGSPRQTAVAVGVLLRRGSPLQAEEAVREATKYSRRPGTTNRRLSSIRLADSRDSGHRPEADRVADRRVISEPADITAASCLAILLASTAR